MPPRGGTEPAPYRGSGAERSTAGYGHPALRVRHRWCTARADVGIGPYEKERATSTTRASGAQRSVCAADGRDGWESRQRSPQKGPSTPDNPSVSLRLTAPFTQGSLGDGGCGLPRRFAPRNDSPDPLSFRGGPTGRRGNPSFLRWTMDGGPGRPTKDEGNGTPSRRPLRKAQSTTQASRRAAKRPRQRPRGVGGNRRKDHPKRGQPPRLPGQRLAKRKARKEQLVKFRFCPMTELCSTAYHVRKSHQSPARAPVGAASTEQNGLEPHPAARQGASRP